MKRKEIQNTHPQTCNFSAHALKRMNQRALSPQTIEMAILYGRMIYAKEARCYVVGKKEATQYRDRGLNIESVEGVHVLVSSTGQVITAYRNRNLSNIRSIIKRRN